MASSAISTTVWLGVLASTMYCSTRPLVVPPHYLLSVLLWYVDMPHVDICTAPAISQRCSYATPAVASG